MPPVNFEVMYGFEDRLYNLLGAMKNVAVPESQDAKACGSQEMIAARVIRNLRRMGAIL